MTLSIYSNWVRGGKRKREKFSSFFSLVPENTRETFRSNDVKFL